MSVGPPRSYDRIGLKKQLGVVGIYPVIPFSRDLIHHPKAPLIFAAVGIYIVIPWGRDL